MLLNGDYEGVEFLSLWENVIWDELVNIDNLLFFDLVLVWLVLVDGIFLIFFDIIEGLLKGILINFLVYF